MISKPVRKHSVPITQFADVVWHLSPHENPAPNRTALSANGRPFSVTPRQRLIVLQTATQPAATP